MPVSWHRFALSPLPALCLRTSGAGPRVIALLLTLAACGDSYGPGVRVTLLCVPSDQTTIDAVFVLNDRAPSSRQWRDDAGFQSEESFELFLPESGVLQITVTLGGVEASQVVDLPESGPVPEVTFSFTGCPCPAAPTGCDASFRCGGLSCYSYCPREMVSATEARSACSAWNGNAGCLATAEGVSACLASELPGLYAFIGLRQDVTATVADEGWRWECDGAAVSDSFWAPFEPSDSIATPEEDHEEDCGVLDYETGRWFAASCSVPVGADGFFCQTR